MATRMLINCLDRCLQSTQRISGNCLHAAVKSKSSLAFARTRRLNHLTAQLFVASDAVLFGELLNGVSTLGGAAKHQGTSDGDDGKKLSVPMPDRIQQSLVWSPGEVSLEDARGRATEVFDGFVDAQGDRGMVCIGSVKSNPVVELLFADTFGCTPFVTEDDVDDVSARSCPFFLRYRDSDPQPGGASAGLRLSKNQDAPDPGFYYENDDGTWSYAGGENKDTALVFYLFRESTRSARHGFEWLFRSCHTFVGKDTCDSWRRILATCLRREWRSDRCLSCAIRQYRFQAESGRSIVQPRWRCRDHAVVPRCNRETYRPSIAASDPALLVAVPFKTPSPHHCEYVVGTFI